MPYMIRDRSTGLYQLGGHYGSFHKNGKIWDSLSHLRGHLTGVKTYKRYGNKDWEIPEEWEVIEISVAPVSVAPAGLVQNGEACKHCKQPKQEHEKKTLKCCFDHTHYALWEKPTP